MSGLSPTSPAASGRRRLLLMITCGWAVRNYLRSGFIPAVQAGVDVTVMLPPGDLHLEDELKAAGCAVVTMPECDAPPWLTTLDGFVVNACNYRLGFWDPFLWNWMVALQPLGKRIYWRFKQAAAKVISKTALYGWARRVQGRGFDRVAARGPYEKLLHDIRPDVVLSTNPYELREAPISRMALAKGLPVIAAIVSWDNVSYKGPFPAEYTDFIVWGGGMQEDLCRHRPTLRPEQIHVAGSPQFDFHLREDLIWTREEFFERIGGDPSRPLITYSGAAVEWAFPREPDIVRHIWEAIQDGRISGRPQLLARAHPVDRTGRFNQLEQECPGIIVQRAWPREIDAHWWFSAGVDQLALLSNTLRHSDVNVNLASSMTLDSAILNTPVVNVAYTTVPQDPRAQRVPNSHRSFHYSRVMKCGATGLAKSREELIAEINAYLANPERHRAGRRKAVDWICGPVDGQATARIAGVVMRCAGVDLAPMQAVNV